jgi:hypothetical protein
MARILEKMPPTLVSKIVSHCSGEFVEQGSRAADAGVVH